MNRIATTAIAAAAVAGIAGGTFAATSGFGAGDRQDAGQSSSTSGTPSPSAGGGNDGPLYLAGRTIVDGDTTVSLTGVSTDLVVSLERAAGGWFVVAYKSLREESLRGTYVDEDGLSTDIGVFDGGWDLNERRDAVVARFGAHYEIRDVATGEVVFQVPTARGAAGPLTDVAFSGDDVIAGWRDHDENQSVVGIDPSTGREYDVVSDTVFDFTTSGDGSRLVGERFRSQEVSGQTCLTGGPVAALEENSWETCDWSTYALVPQFSPDGTQVLTVPYDTEGFGPTSYAVLNSDTGRISAEIDAPDRATSAVWADDDALFVHGYESDEMTGGLVYECTLAGDCKEIVSSKRSIVLGS